MDKYSTDEIKRNSGWELRLTQSEINTLMRENQHLIEKSKERLLTRWEAIRQSEIHSDIGRLTRKARELMTMLERKSFH